MRLRVTAPPDKGKANKAVLTLVAKSLGVAKSTVTLTAGDTARQKTLHIAGNEKDLLARCEQAFVQTRD